MSLFFPAVSRLVLVATLVTLVLAGPAVAEPAADPRDAQIQELQRRLDEQSQQIEALRKTMEALQGTLSAPASQGSLSTDPSQQPPSTSTAQQPPVTTGDSDDDPGPEPPAALEAGSNPASGSATGQQPSMNPNISVIGLFEGKAGGAHYDPNHNSFYLNEIELAIQAPIDPNARADIYLAFPNREAPEVEEATLTWTGLPGGLQAKGGLLRADFGRINQLHTHAYPQIDAPLVNRAIFGPESLRDPGVELSVLAPTPWYSKLSVQGLSRSVGPSADEFSALDPVAPMSREELIERLVEGDEFSLFPSDGSKNLLWVGRWENLVDLSENSTLSLGLSGATSDINGVDLRNAQAVGADLTFKWSPVDQLGKSLVWQTEMIRARQKYADAQRDFGGWYSYVNYRHNRNWLGGVRYGQTELPLDPSLVQRRATALLEYSPSEWNSLRFQFNHNTSNYRPSFNEFLVQWNIAIGPHGAHKY